MIGYKQFLITIFIAPLFACKALSTPHPYSYCTKDQCRIIAGQQMLFFGPLPEQVIRICRDQNMYALTFDDGPTDRWPEVLGLLAKHEIKATFFVNGRNLKSEVNQNYIKQAYKQGHQISNHTTAHKNLLELSREQILDEIISTKDLLISILGSDSQVVASAYIVRPPFGYINDRVQKIFEQSGFRAVRWNSDRYDWELKPEESNVYLTRFYQHLDFIKQHESNGIQRSIIDVNHDRSQATIESLDALIDAAKASGYRFVTIQECIN